MRVYGSGAPKSLTTGAEFQIDCVDYGAERTQDPNIFLQGFNVNVKLINGAQTKLTSLI